MWCEAAVRLLSTGVHVTMCMSNRGRAHRAGTGTRPGTSLAAWTADPIACRCSKSRGLKVVWGKGALVLAQRHDLGRQRTDDLPLFLVGAMLQHVLDDVVAYVRGHGIRFVGLAGTTSSQCTGITQAQQAHPHCRSRMMMTMRRACAAC